MLQVNYLKENQVLLIDDVYLYWHYEFKESVY